MSLPDLAAIEDRLSLPDAEFTPLAREDLRALLAAIRASGIATICPECGEAPARVAVYPSACRPCSDRLADMESVVWAQAADDAEFVSDLR